MGSSAKDTRQYTGGAVTPEQAQTLAHDIMFIQAFLEKVRGYANETTGRLDATKSR